MDIALWIASGLLALMVMLAGGAKVFVPRVKLLDKMGWAASWSDGPFRLLGLAELLGAVGVIVPHATGILPILTPVAAACLVMLMAGAVKTHVDRKESPALPAILGLLGVFVALGRFGIF